MPSYFSGFDNTDKGADDSFIVQATSATIDQGNPNNVYVNEPMPNGDRVNIGSTGNTSRAASQASPKLYLLNPNGLEKLPTGSVTSVQSGIGTDFKSSCNAVKSR